MSLIKKAVIITDNLIIADGGASVTTQSQATTTGFIKHIFIKLTNNVTGHAISVPSADVQTSTDNINFYSFKVVTGSLVPSTATSTSFNMPTPVQYIRIVWISGGGTGSTTVRAEYSEVKERGESLTDESGGLIPVGSLISNNLNVSVEILLELKRIRLGFSVLTGKDLDDIDDLC